jgi:hypothetical protein
VKVLALIYGDEQQWESASEKERNEIYAKYRAFGEQGDGKIADGAELAPTRTATTVRVREGKTLVTDGPFVETKEALGGYYLIEAKDLDQALAIGKLCPARFGGVEVRPIMVFDQ